MYFTHHMRQKIRLPEKKLMLMSESQEIALGQEADPSIVAEYGLYDNPVLQNFITTKGKRNGCHFS